MDWHPSGQDASGRNTTGPDAAGRHPTEQDLVLHFYGDGTAADELHVDEHLRGCRECQAAWVDLRETMQLVDAAPVPEPGDGFERVLWARVQPTIADLRAARRPSWRRPLVLVQVGAFVSTVVVAAAGGVAWRVLHSEVSPASSGRGAGAVSTAASARPGAQALALERERVLLAALNGHFDEAQLVLTELMNDPDSSDLGFARATAGDLVASGRLYEETAKANGNVQLASMLDDLEAVLLDVARTPDGMNAEDLASLRGRITDSNLLFKVQALANEVRERQKTLATE